MYSRLINFIEETICSAKINLVFGNILQQYLPSTQYSTSLLAILIKIYIHVVRFWIYQMSLVRLIMTFFAINSIVNLDFVVNHWIYLQVT